MIQIPSHHRGSRGLFGSPLWHPRSSRRVYLFSGEYAVLFEENQPICKISNLEIQNPQYFREAWRFKINEHWKLKPTSLLRFPTPERQNSVFIKFGGMNVFFHLFMLWVAFAQHTVTANPFLADSPPALQGPCVSSMLKHSWDTLQNYLIGKLLDWKGDHSEPPKGPLELWCLFWTWITCSTLFIDNFV